MTKTDQGWDVLDEEAGVLSYEYAFQKASLARCMSTRLADGTLALISPPCRVSERVIEELGEIGEVSALIAPNGFHWLGLEQWSKALPNARLYAPERAAKRIAKKTRALPPFEPLSALQEKLPSGSRIFDVPGIKIGETWLTTRAEEGPIWYVSDSFFSMAELPKAFLPRMLFHLTKSAPGFRVNRLGMKLFAEDPRGYEAWLRERVEEQIPEVVVTAHGDIVRGDVGKRIREAIDAGF